ncbi:MAG: pyruvate formate lyase family protein, partial [Oscillospiraceae bacterium]|nr:pyruvate formate lyase family protein [Oscillospiraceae bacterium]
TQPFLSALCGSCIERGLDINRGGTKYPSVHGAACMGIGTVADSLAAMDQLVFTEHRLILAELRDALKANFEGYEDLRQQLLAAPKYGNNDERADRYAVWYLEEHDRLLRDYRTPDGGRIYIAMASNVTNIPAGRETAATPDGRKQGEPLSDAASPMHGMDTKGPTCTVLSTTKPDYTLAACGTVLNQKYSPSVFIDPVKRAKLAALIRVYFQKGGQEMQINSVSREVLMDAMEHPERYPSLVVRVSGFSALFVTLDRAVQEDILSRTEQM